MPKSKAANNKADQTESLRADTLAGCCVACSGQKGKCDTWRMFEVPAKVNKTMAAHGSTNASIQGASKPIAANVRFGINKDAS
jgi:hypothetical protein